MDGTITFKDETLQKLGKEIEEEIIKRLEYWNAVSDDIRNAEDLLKRTGLKVFSTETLMWKEKRIFVRGRDRPLIETPVKERCMYFKKLPELLEEALALFKLMEED